MKKDEMNTRRKHIVIIGGGFGGIATAKALENANVDITIIDRLNHHLFQPLLYQVATAELSPGDIAAPIRAIINKNPKAKVILAEVKKIDPKNKSVHLQNGTSITFDQLVMATGAQYNYFGHEEWAEYAPGMKSVSDALKVREQLLMSMEEAEQLQDHNKRKSLLTYVIIGGGPTGVEMAGAIAETAGNGSKHGYKTIKPEDAKIYLIEAGPRILNAFPESLGEKARKTLKKMGVKVLLNTPVTNIEKNKVHLKVGSIETPNIIWAAGIKASSLLDSLKVKQDRTGRVFVSPDLSIPEYPDIFIIGDSAHSKGKDGKPLPALAPVATQQGKFVGNLLAQGGKRQKTAKFNYIDKGTMATIGRAKAVADIKGLKFSGFFAWFLWSFIHVLSLIGFRNRTRVFVEWIWNYFTYKRGVRLITDRSKCNSCTTYEKPHNELLKMQV
ncbi:NAD(P)/FAD-dependent oxidoreductase [Aequorivita marina]|uniref:NAD(P)/FAD-dependent oxidoreductase n=1 Tax=Aequorivita marina TaxID=3073654 RepID=UPI0028767707|nr:NAD(P)/FAD-dependent oxidoreductase [Aequorivita sp. S2608]MDS1299168.1 NAD(P)/FAD-dependent oxidoreductase [Aequorivita sp. S2608]